MILEIIYRTASPSWTDSGWWCPTHRAINAKIKLLTPSIEMYHFNVKTNGFAPKAYINTGTMSGQKSSRCIVFFPKIDLISLKATINQISLSFRISCRELTFCQIPKCKRRRKWASRTTTVQSVERHSCALHRVSKRKAVRTTLFRHRAMNSETCDAKKRAWYANRDGSRTKVRDN